MVWIACSTTSLYDNEIIVSGTAGRFNKNDSLPVTEDSIYGIGSTSKMFTTVAVMLLVDQGKLDLDKPVTFYPPDFVMLDAGIKKLPFACCSTIPRDRWALGTLMAVLLMTLTLLTTILC